MSLFFLLKAAAEFEQNYPETMKTCLLVNVPSIFHHIYHMAKFILKEEVRQKLKVLGSKSISLEFTSIGLLAESVT